MQDRYDRQQRIKSWNQDLLASARVLLVGAGALGNEILKNLALLGIGNILVVDFDHIETSNLSRTVLFSVQDKARSKAETAARAAQNLNPEVRVTHLHADVFFDLGLGFYRRADLIISGLDNLAARAKVAQCAFLTGKPYLDSGIWALGGELRCFLPGKSFCFDCTLSETDWLHAHTRRSCSGFRSANAAIDEPAPSNIATVSIIGGMAAQEAVKLLCKTYETALESGDALVYNGARLSLHQSRLSGDEPCQCRLGQPLTEVEPLLSTVSDLTVGAILDWAEAKIGTPATLELGRDVLFGYRKACQKLADCPNNGLLAEPCLLSKVDEAERICPVCAAFRAPDTRSRLTRASGLDTYTLSQLGIAPGEVLTLWKDDAYCFLELQADILHLWP